MGERLEPLTASSSVSLLLTDSHSSSALSWITADPGEMSSGLISFLRGLPPETCLPRFKCCFFFLRQGKSRRALFLKKGESFFRCESWHGPQAWSARIRRYEVLLQAGLLRDLYDGEEFLLLAFNVELMFLMGLCSEFLPLSGLMLLVGGFLVSILLVAGLLVAFFGNQKMLRQVDRWNWAWWLQV